VPHFAGRAETRARARQGRGANIGDGTLAAHLEAILRHFGGRSIASNRDVGIRRRRGSARAYQEAEAAPRRPAAKGVGGMGNAAAVPVMRGPT
jgi:hypothetical protein